MNYLFNVLVLSSVFIQKKKDNKIITLQGINCAISKEFMCLSYLQTQKSHQRPIITVLKGYKCKNKACDPPSVSSVWFKIELSPTEQIYMSQKLRKDRFLLLFSFVVLPSSFLTLSIINILKCNCCIYCKAQLQPCSNPAEWKFQLKNIRSTQADKQQGFSM